MVASASAQPIDSGLAALPARPPTPPKETSYYVPAPARPPSQQVVADDDHQHLQTPPSLPTLVSPITTESAASTGRPRKKVGWSVNTAYGELQSQRASERMVRSSPLAAGGSRPIRGILKPSSSPFQPSTALSNRLNGLDESVNMSQMLSSACQQLRSVDYHSRLDAYMMLTRALKTSNNLPDRVALQGSLGELTQFIQRDIATTTDSGIDDRNLATRALSLLATILHFNAIASTIPHDFNIHITDYAILSFQDPQVPKEAVRYLMQIVALQSPSPKVLSSDRVGRLLDAVNKMEDHMSGKSLVMGRIQLYKRLIKHCPHHMATHTSWLQDLFTDMLSRTKDIRTEAIFLGMEAGFSLRLEKHILRHITEILQTSSDNQAFIDYYIGTLQEMLKDRELAAAVPQIWTVLNLFMKCPLERWKWYEPWLKIVQSAFNATDNVTKLEANHAWANYVYLSLSDGRVTPKALSTLCQPLLTQLRKRALPKQTDEAAKLRRTVHGGICNMLYYAFKPGNEKQSVEMPWDYALQPIITQLISLGQSVDSQGDPLSQATKLLNSLMDSTTPRVWREDRIRDTSVCHPDELPPINAKWIRRQSDRVFELIGPILECRIADLADKQSPVYQLWQSVVGAVAAASAKDIKVSDDMQLFFANTFTLLFRLWAKGDSVDATSTFLLGIRHFIELLIHRLGTLPFTEKKLVMLPTSMFKPATTAAARLPRSEGTIRTPLLHLLNMLCTIPSNVKDDDHLSDLIITVFEPFLHGKTEKSRLELVREILGSMPRGVMLPAGLWLLVSRYLERPFKADMYGAQKDRVLGPEYREMVTFLEKGLISHPHLRPTAWLSVMETFDSHVLQSSGQAGRILVLVEPLAKVLSDIEQHDHSIRDLRFTSDLVTTLLDKARYPDDHQAMNEARRLLWGAAPVTTLQEASRPFDNLYKATNLVLRSVHDNLDPDAISDSASSLLEALTSFISNLPSNLGEQALVALENGVKLCVVGGDGQTFPIGDSPVRPIAHKLWGAVLPIMVSTATKNGTLGVLESLFSAGCSSADDDIARASFDAWEVAAGNNGRVQCSSQLELMLKSLKDRFTVKPSRLETDSHPARLSKSTTPLRKSTRNRNLRSQRLSTTTGDDVASADVEILQTRPGAESNTLPEVSPERASLRSLSEHRTPQSRQNAVSLAISSPVLGESQHLKPSGSRSMIATSITDQAPIVAADPALATRLPHQHVRSERQERTPECEASYEKLITSTPTPRRGTVPQIDGLTDLPSSPPEPRPNPLLPEIQARLRMSDSMNTWDFSSPLNSPPANTQQSEAHPAPETPSKGSSAEKNPEAALQTGQWPSSPPVDYHGVTQETASQTEEVLSRRLRQRRHTSVPRATFQRKSSPQKEIKSVVRRRRGRPSARDAIAHPATSPDNDRASTLEPIQETPLGQESLAELPSHSASDPGVPGTKRQGVAKEHAVIIKTEAVSLAPPSPRITRNMASMISEPSTPPRLPSQPKRKRRASKFEGVQKRTKRAKPEAQHGEVERGGSARSTRSSRRANRSPRNTRVHESDAEEDAWLTSSPVAQAEAGGIDDAIDTDEEVLSQLVAESAAASQSQISTSFIAASPHEAPPGAAADLQSRGSDVMDLEPADVSPRQANSGAGSAFMEVLSTGKAILSGAIISRAEAGAIEDMLMDLKRELYQAEYRGRK